MIDVMDRPIPEIRLRLMLMQAALSFYGDERNWQVWTGGRLVVMGRRSDFAYGLAYEENGRIARAALAGRPLLLPGEAVKALNEMLGR